MTSNSESTDPFCLCTSTMCLYLTFIESVDHLCDCTQITVHGSFKWVSYWPFYLLQYLRRFPLCCWSIQMVQFAVQLQVHTLSYSAFTASRMMKWKCCSGNFIDMKRSDYWQGNAVSFSDGASLGQAAPLQWGAGPVLGHNGVR